MQTVKIRVRKPTRVLTFLCKDIELNREERCIVRSDRGLEYGTCVLPPEPCTAEMEERYKMQVVRKATSQDESTFLRIQEDEQNAAAVCRRKIDERKLPMKLVDTEYTFDKNKIVFYFTAADRVDFRDLVRDLAHELKTRIELRHIQVRDEAKIVGGIGVCGRELCCSTWLREFKPISMKMAKRQNLSLNPSKISGQCGRLLCCLSYENELYQKRKQRNSREAAEAAEEAAVALGINTSNAYLAPHEVDALAAYEARKREGGMSMPLAAPADAPREEPERSGRPPIVEPEKKKAASPDSAQSTPAKDVPNKAGGEQKAQPGADEKNQSNKPPRRRRRRRRKRKSDKGGDSGSSASAE